MTKTPGLLETSNVVEMGSLLGADTTNDIGVLVAPTWTLPNSREDGLADGAGGMACETIV